MTDRVLLLFITVPCAGLQCVIVVVPDHTHIRFLAFESKKILQFCSIDININTSYMFRCRWIIICTLVAKGM